MVGRDGDAVNGRKSTVCGTQTEHGDGVRATDGNDMSTAEVLLPILHGGLRVMAKEKPLAAIGIAESVTITPPGRASTRAIKVLFEHVRGLTLALYVPCEKKVLRGYV